MATSNKLWILMARTLSGEASVQEQSELAAALQADETLRQQFELLTRLWQGRTPMQQENIPAIPTAGLSRIFYRAGEADPSKAKRPKGKKLRFIFWGLSAAAAVTAAFLFINPSPALPSQFIKQEKVLAAEPGSRSSTILPDGSRVWLNAGSRLFYDNHFSGSIREVKLEGEAYFDVVKDARRPFIVHTSGVDIKVLGTAFNVKAYPEDENIETTLIRGAVQVYRQEEGIAGAIMLKPNEKISLSKKPASNTKQAGEPEKVKLFEIQTIAPGSRDEELVETAWVYNRLEFRGESFEELVPKMERWYDVQIHLEDEKVKNLRFNGSFEKETVGEAFEALRFVIPFTFKIKGNEIYVRSFE